METPFEPLRIAVTEYLPEGTLSHERLGKLRDLSEQNLLRMSQHERDDSNKVWNALADARTHWSALKHGAEEYWATGKSQPNHAHSAKVLEKRDIELFCTLDVVPDGTVRELLRSICLGPNAVLDPKPRML